MERIDLNNLSSEAARLVTKAWVEQNSACPYQKTGERVLFATPRSSAEHPALREAIEALGISNFGITFTPIGEFKNLVSAQEKRFRGELSEVLGPDIRHIVAQAGVHQGSSEGIGS